jgi:hypothetical protein
MYADLWNYHPALFNSVREAISRIFARNPEKIPALAKGVRLLGEIALSESDPRLTSFAENIVKGLSQTQRCTLALHL